MEILKSETFKAAKEHRCNMCGGRIKKGQTYNYQFNVYGGDSWAHKSHLLCEELCRMLNWYAEADSEGVTQEFFQENVYEEFHSYMRDRLPEEMSDIRELLYDVTYETMTKYLHEKIKSGEIKAPNLKKLKR